MEDYTVNIIKSAPQTQAPKKKKGLKIVAIILFALGLAFCWLPYLGVILCAAAVVFLIVAKAKGQLGTAPFIIFIILSVIAGLLGMLLSSAATVHPDDEVIDSAATLISMKNDMEVYDTSGMKAESKKDGLYHITGTLLLADNDYLSLESDIYKVEVDCMARCSEDTNWKGKIDEESSVLQPTPVKTEALAEAITKVDQKELVKKAEEKFHEKVQLKNESSYVLNDSGVGAVYDEDGNIIIAVILDYSAENSFGGMVRSRYEVDFKQYKNGDISCIGSKELS